MASEPGPAMEFMGSVAYHFEMMRPLLPTYLHLLVSAIFPIYTAAHASLTRPSSAAPRKSKKSTPGGDEIDEEGTSTRIESLSPSDAIMFPLLAGVTLASLYFILKWLQDPGWLNWFLGVYFAQIGLFFATKFVKDALCLVRSIVLPNEFSRDGVLWKIDQNIKGFKTAAAKCPTSPLPGLIGRLPLPQGVTTGLWKVRGHLYTQAQLRFHVRHFIDVKTSVEPLDILSLIISCGIVGYHTFIDKPWFLTNFLGFSFCYGSLQYVTPTTGWTGTLILSALFFYDIYFVFFTPMMVTVATKLDVPIKLLFPRPDGCVLPVGAVEGSVAMEEYLKCLAKKRTMAMLGLGDIVVPGMILAFALRFDLYLHYLRQSSPGNKESETATKPLYYKATGGWGERFWTSSRLWSKETSAKIFTKTYFFATIFGYLFGMIVTVVVMQVAQHAQPALLYLVPGVLGSLWGTALVKGDLKTLWNYNETPEEDKDDKNTKSKSDPARTSKAEKADNGHEKSFAGGEAKMDEKDSQKQNSKVAKKNSGQDDRRLVYFSITLPEGPEKNTLALTSNNTKAETAAEDDIVPGSMNEDKERTGDGEPPGKRARRS